MFPSDDSPGVSEQDFSAALQAFAAVVGAEWVFASDEDVALYRDAYSPLRGEADERVASAAVAPDNAEQVREVVRIAKSLSNPALSDFDWQEPRLRRVRAGAVR
jgi:4-cresol dehydrogenase (hydroxylating)